MIDASELIETLTGLPIGIQPLAGLRVQFDETDVAEVGTVGEPQRAVRRVAKHAGIDRVAVLDAVGPHHRSRVLPLVVRRLGIERLADQEADRRLRLRAWRGVVEKVLVAEADQVRRPRVVAAARDDVRARFAAGHRLHDAARPPPRPAVVGDRHGQAAAGGIDVVLAVFDDHGRGIVQTGLAVQCHDRNGEHTRRGDSDTGDAGRERQCCGHER